VWGTSESWKKCRVWGTSESWKKCRVWGTSESWKKCRVWGTSEPWGTSESWGLCSDAGSLSALYEREICEKKRHRVAGFSRRGGPKTEEIACCVFSSPSRIREVRFCDPLKKRPFETPRFRSTPTTGFRVWGLGFRFEEICDKTMYTQHDPFSEETILSRYKRRPVARRRVQQIGVHQQ
jgi:hypothetical protein